MTVYKQAWGYLLSSPVATDVEAPDVEQQTFSITQGGARPGPSEWWGGHAVQGRSAGQGVALAPANSSADLGSVRQGRSGSFCVCREHTLPAVFLDHRQERSAGCGCSVACMAQDPAVCVSAGGSDTAHSRSGTQMEWAF